MKPFYLTVCFYLLHLIQLNAQEHDLFHLFGTTLLNDQPDRAHFARFSPRDNHAVDGLSGTAAKTITLYRTQKGASVEAYYFPGRSDKKALVIGGLHGSELSSIEVANALLQQLSTGEKPYYTVVVIPSVFPDNAAAARQEKRDRLQNNTGRYSHAHTADPNRQMPLPGRPFLPEHPFDAMDREIEGEAQTVLRLIQEYSPERLIAIHAIRDQSKAGIFADPRTDCAGNAIGFAPDSALAIMMAKLIQSGGGTCAGNRLDETPTAVYHLDPPAASAGQKQWRNYQVTNLQGKGRGISLGTWSSTAVCDEEGERSRPAIMTYTMEFPGYQTPSEYTLSEEKERTARMIELYAGAIRQCFLQSLYTEEERAGVPFAFKR